MKQPYIHGIIDTLVGAELIRQFDIQHKNRLGVILLDSAFETACRAFIQYVEKIPVTDKHQQRHTLVSTVKSKLKDIDAEVWEKIDWYYTEIRCDFVHKSAGKTIIEELYLDYKDIVEFVIDRALGIESSKLVEEEIIRIKEYQSSNDENEEIQFDFDFHKNKNMVDRVVAGVHALNPKKVEELNTFYKKQGVPLKLTDKDFYGILARNTGSKKYFYNDKDEKNWKLSEVGKKHLLKFKQQ